MTTTKSPKELRENLMACLIDVIERAPDKYSLPLFEALKEFDAGYKIRHQPLASFFKDALEEGLYTYFMSEEMEREETR